MEERKEDLQAVAPVLSKKEQKKQEKAEKKRKKKEKKWAKQRRLLFPANKKGRHVMHLMNFLRILLVPIHKLVFPYKIYGSKKVPDGAYLYVGNHYSVFDIIYPARTTWEGVHFMAKQSVFESGLGVFARKLGAIGAMRDGSDVRTLMESMKVLKNGEKLSIFPEGTRNKVSDEEFLPFRDGSALIAIKTKTPIIPFVICNRPHVFRRTHVVFGEPMDLSEYYGRKLSPSDYSEAEAKLKSRLYEMREEHRAMLAAKKRKGKKCK